MPTLSSLPSAGRLPLCISNWNQVTSDPWILQCVVGCHLELLSPPFQQSCPQTLQLSRDQQAVQEEVDKLMSKEAISIVRTQRDQFVSRIFTVPKKDGSQRPVVNLKPLNLFIRKQCFKMEGMGMLKSILQRGDWMISIDLKDAYLSVVMAEEHRRYLRFEWRNQLFEFRCLPFGLSSAPRTFMKLLKPVMALLRQQGTRTIIFLDDILVMAQLKEDLMRQTRNILQLLQLSGFVINFEKSIFTPGQIIPYLGFVIDSVKMMISLPREKIRSDHTGLRVGSATEGDFCAGSFQTNRTHDSNNAGCPTSTTLLQESTENQKQGLQGIPKLCNNSDPRPERKGRIDMVENSARELEWESSTTSCPRCHNGDGCISLGMGCSLSTRSHALANSVCQLWQWCLQRGITLSAEYLPGANNTVADQESRLLLSSAEWILNRGVFNWVMMVMGPCQLDLFTSRLNHQLRKYVSWRPDPFAMATDAFQLVWKDQKGYAFPHLH